MAGLESVHYTLTQQGISSNNTGPTGSGANYQFYAFQRTVRSAFGEIEHKRRASTLGSLALLAP